MKTYQVPYDKNFQAYERKYADMLVAVANGATSMHRQGSHRVYLCYMRGVLALVTETEDIPEGMSLATPEPIPMHFTTPKLVLWIRNLLHDLPILPVYE